MATYRITPGQLPGALRGAARRSRSAVDRGVRRAAQKGKARLIQATNEKKIPYLGQYKNSFHIHTRAGKWQGGREALEAGTLARLYNDAPHAGIVELGARPHPVSEEGIQAIAEWVKKKGLLGEAPRRTGYARKSGLKGSGPLTPMAAARYHEAADAYEQEARSIAEAIAWKIRRHGQKGRYVFRDEMPTLTRYVAEEVAAAIAEAAKSPPRGPKK